LAACDIPTDVPILEQRWVIPVEESSLGVDELLPSGVSVAGNNFSVSVDPVSAGESLGALCPSCLDSGGLSVPVPPFSGSFSSSSSLPADVVGAVISGATVQIVVQNGFAFDPLAGGGTVTVTLNDGPGGRQLGQVVLHGTTDALPGGATTSRALTIAPGSVGTSLVATAAVTTTGGQLAPLDRSHRISVTATTTSMLLSSATVNVSGRAVQIDPVDLDVEGIDGAVTDRIQSGSLLLDIVNPFGVSVTGNVVIGSVTKSFTVPASGTSRVTLGYSGDELRSFLGKPNVTFTGSGTASGGNVTITPAQTMTLKATLDITIRIG
jgi:hypothetical protein